MVPTKLQIVAFVFACAQIAVIAWLDYITSYEISLGVVYYAPIAYAAWRIGGLASFGIAVLCVVAMTWAELASGMPFSSHWVLAERAFMRALAFGFVAFSFGWFKRSADRDRQKINALEGLLTLCMCCRKVRDEHDNWLEVDAFLREHPGLSRPKLCPTCARATYAASGRAD